MLDWEEEQAQVCGYHGNNEGERGCDKGRIIRKDLERWSNNQTRMILTLSGTNYIFLNSHI
jgi:hypothetical protein